MPAVPCLVCAAHAGSICCAVCQSRELLSSSGLRSDGRRWSELRSVLVQCGVASSASGADGSCSFQQGNTLVLATVFGPRELAGNGVLPGGPTDTGGAAGCCRLSVSLKQASFASGVRREQRRSDKRVAEMSAVIRQSLTAAVLTHLFPNSHIAVCLTIVHDDGGVMAAALNAATLALLHAAIPLKDIPVAVTLACTLSSSQQQWQSAESRAQTADGDTSALSALSASSLSTSSPSPVVVLDPSVSEVAAVGGQSGCVLQLSFGCCSERIVFVLSSGRLPVAELTGMLSASQAACHAIHQRMKDEMRRCSQSSGSSPRTRGLMPLAVS